jgi:protoheme IX farnesyltransferase
MTGLFYTFGALLLGGGFLYYALRLKFAPRQDSPMTTFRYSIWYLMALFSFLLIDHYIPAIWPA